MANPLVDQGVLNRLRASVVIPAFPDLNVTAPYTAKAGIRLALEGNSTTPIQTMTGVAQSAEPYMMANITMALLRTQGLANLYKAQMELLSLIGPVQVYPDNTENGLGVYNFQNCSIMSVSEMPFDGTDPAYAVTLSGIYYINSSMWAA